MLQKPPPNGGGFFISATARASVFAYNPKKHLLSQKLKTGLMHMHHANFTNFVA